MNQYIVLARKYRPQQFDDLVGQELVTRTLKNSITLNRIPHALLLTGTRGVGKTTTARIFAKALNCEKGPTTTPCGVCSNCVEITQGSNVDVYEIDGASNTSVDDVRSLKENVQYTPIKSRFKIYIIDEVHMLSTSAFNALLKTLEEPPAGVYFVFATTEAHKIPDTILSRCQRHDFRQITDQLVEKHLKKILGQEKIAMSDTAISLVARQSNGSLRDALSLLDQVISIAGEKISDDEVVASLGLTDRTLIHQTLESFMEYDSSKSLSTVAKVFEKGFDSKVYLSEIWEWVRNMIVYKNSPNKELVSVSPDDLELLQARASQVPMEELERWFDLLKTALMSLGRVEFPRYVIEITFLRITRREKRVMIQDLLNRLDQLDKGGESTSTQKAASSNDWNALLTEIKKQKPSYAATISHAREISWKENLIHIVFETPFHAARADEKEFQQFLLGLADRLSGKANQFKVETKTSIDSSVKPPAKERPKLDIPIVQKAVSIFDATVDDIETIG